MTTIPDLLTTGHRLFHALLMEARAAMDEGDWADAQVCLSEFTRRLETHMSAEEVVLFPRVARQGAEVDATLTQCQREHDGLRLDIRRATAAAYARDRVGFKACLTHLIDALYHHCQAEERRLYTRTDAMDEDDLSALARALRACDEDEGTPGAIEPADPRLH